MEHCSALHHLDRLQAATADNGKISVKLQRRLRPRAAWQQCGGVKLSAARYSNNCLESLTPPHLQHRASAPWAPRQLYYWGQPAHAATFQSNIRAIVWGDPIIYIQQLIKNSLNLFVECLNIFELFDASSNFFSVTIENTFEQMQVYS